MASIPSPPPPAVLARFSLVIGGLVRALVARSGSRVMTDAMIMLLTRRLSIIGLTVQRLALAIRTGTLRTRRSPAPGGARRRGAPAALVLPRGRAWLVRLIGPDAVASGLYLRAVLDDPEMIALLAASPLLVRTLRPLCRMLAVELPPVPDPVPPASPPAMSPGGDASAMVDPGAGAGDAAPRRVPHRTGRRRPVSSKTGWPKIGLAQDRHFRALIVPDS